MIVSKSRGRKVEALGLVVEESVDVSGGRR